MTWREIPVHASIFHKLGENVSAPYAGLTASWPLSGEGSGADVFRNVSQNWIKQEEGTQRSTPALTGSRSSKIQM